MTDRRPESMPARPPMSAEQRQAYRLRLKSKLFRDIRGLFHRLNKEKGLTQKEIARRLEIDEALVSKRLRGDANLTLNTLCDLARAMDARVDVKVTPLADVQRAQMSTSAPPMRFSSVISEGLHQRPFMLISSFAVQHHGPAASLKYLLNFARTMPSAATATDTATTRSDPWRDYGAYLISQDARQHAQRSRMN